MTVTALDSRRPIIGGSTIAAAAGIDPYCSRVELYFRVTGQLPAVEETEPMAWGKRAQSLIFQALREDHDLDATEYIGGGIADPAFPWLLGHPDGFADGAIVEAKLTGWHHDSLPLPWQAQAQTYMFLARAERTLIAVLERGTHLALYWLDYSPRAATALLEAGASFVDYVRRGEIPPPDGSASARDALAQVFPATEPGLAVQLDTEAYKALQAIREWREVESHAHDRRTELENIVKAAMGDAELAYDPAGRLAATWKASVSHRTDTKGLKAKHPVIAARFTTDTHLRTFRLT